MSDLEIVHPVDASEIRPMLATLATTFLDEARGEAFEFYVDAWTREWHLVRPWAARADGRWVATLVTEPHRMRIPDGRDGTTELTVDGLTAVTVNATHRRRGLLTRMLTEALEEAKERGDPLSILLAAEWPIYGRYGYAPASRAAQYTYFPRRRGAAIESSGVGHVRQVDPGDIGDIARAVFDRSRAERAGQIDRDNDWWARRLGLEGYRPPIVGKAPSWYLHEGPDGPDGLLSWSATKDFELDGDMGAITVGEFVTASDNAYRNLWAYLSGIDVVEQISLRRRPVDEPVRWLLPDGRTLRETYAGDDLWLRLLDVPAALSARGYATDDRLVIEVSDEDTGRFGAGRYVLDSGARQCTPTTASADIEIRQRALAALYLGGFTLREQRLGGGAQELTPGAIARLDAMFATTLPPWNATGF